MRKFTVLSFLTLVFFQGTKENTAQFNYYTQGKSNRMAAEWEPASGVMITWPLGIPYKLVVELAKDITLYTLVQSDKNKQEALSWYRAWGIDTAKCKFIFARQGEDAWWIRDWGPPAVYTSNRQMMLGDPKYRYSTPIATSNCDGKLEFLYRTPNNQIRFTNTDDSATLEIGKGLNLAVLDLPFASTGGNVITDGMGTAFSTCVLTAENRFSGISVEKFFALNESLLGIERYNILPNFEPKDIQHIDCLLKLIDEETLLVLRPPPDHPHHQVYELIIKDYLSKLKTIYGRPYKILRIDSYRYKDDLLAAYTNSLILNRTVYIPLFGIPQDSFALKRWTELMPGYAIKGFPFKLNREPVDNKLLTSHYQDIGWYMSDALHCRTRAIWDKEMLFLNVKRLADTVSSAKARRVFATVIDYSGKGLIENGLKLCWRITGAEKWNEIVLHQDRDSSHFYADLLKTGSKQLIEYYVTVSSKSGRNETMPRTAPAGYFSSLVTNKE